MEYHAPFGSGDPDASYVDKNVPGAVAGSKVPAPAIEDPQRSIVAAQSGAALTAADDNSQLSQAIIRQGAGGAMWCIAGGTANAVTLTAPSGWSKPAALFDGMTARFLPTALNTGATTINAFGLGAKSLLLPSGGALTGSEVKANTLTEVIYSSAAAGGSGAWLLSPWANPVSYRESLTVTRNTNVVMTHNTFTLLPFTDQNDDGLISGGVGTWNGSRFTSNIKARFACRYRATLDMPSGDHLTISRFQGSSSVQAWLHGGVWLAALTGVAYIAGAGEFVMNPGDHFEIAVLQQNGNSVNRTISSARAVISLAS